jgi:Leucine-rich repeat (LRR) protein
MSCMKEGSTFGGMSGNELAQYPDVLNTVCLFLDARWRVFTLSFVCRSWNRAVCFDAYWENVARRSLLYLPDFVHCADLRSFVARCLESQYAQGISLKKAFPDLAEEWGDPRRLKWWKGITFVADMGGVTRLTVEGNTTFTKRMHDVDYYTNADACKAHYIDLRFIPDTVVELRLGGNALSSGAFRHVDGLPNSLTFLRLSGNDLSGLAFHELPRTLKELHIADAQVSITALSRMLHGLCALQVLDVSGNDLPDLPWRSLPSTLNVLVAQRNNLTALHSSYLCAAMTRVDLSHNRLERVALETVPETLLCLDVSHNALTRFVLPNPPCRLHVALAYNKSLKVLDVGGGRSVTVDTTGCPPGCAVVDEEELRGKGRRRNGKSPPATPLPMDDSKVHHPKTKAKK